MFRQAFQNDRILILAFQETGSRYDQITVIWILASDYMTPLLYPLTNFQTNYCYLYESKAFPSLKNVKLKQNVIEGDPVKIRMVWHLFLIPSVQEVVTLQKIFLTYLHQKMRFTPFINYYDTLG